MKLKTAIKNIGKLEATKFAKLVAREEGINWESGIGFVFSAILSDPERAPGDFGGKKDNEKTLIKKWVLKYKNGIAGKASTRTSNLPGTIADPIIEEIINTRLPALTKKDLNKITYAHRLGMSTENILGSILEEYLSNKLINFGWHCAWGETVKSVDFVHEDGRLLQIKNRSNSENSSSSAIRTGTQIEKWFRVKAQNNEYMWEVLNKICGTTELNENDFVAFARKTIQSNPGCLAVEPQNPWQ